MVKQLSIEHKALYDLYYKRVYRTAYYIVKDAYYAEDVLQSVFLKVFKHLEKVHDKENLESWIDLITTRTAIDWLKKQKKWRDVPTSHEILDNIITRLETASSVEEKIENNLLFEDILDKMKVLSWEDQEIITLKYLHSLKDEEISKHLGIPIGTVKAKIHRAKKKVKNKLKTKEGGDS